MLLNNDTSCLKKFPKQEVSLFKSIWVNISGMEQLISVHSQEIACICYLRKPSSISSLEFQIVVNIFSNWKKVIIGKCKSSDSNKIIVSQHQCSYFGDT